MMYSLYNSHALSLILLLLAIWTIPWKAYALWLAVKRNQKIWFIIILILNTVGILEIFYVFKIANKSWAEVKGDFRKAWKSIFG
ncbi:MAG: DUF5652 family protein [Candidatus Pacebacteria bacterium]|nr:DUF5652 family protein [Candidatus Paceibacterota bacterium]